MRPKIALITGASSEIGSVLVKTLLEAGVKVFAQIHQNKTLLRPLEDSPLLQIIPQDLSRIEQAEELVQKVVQTAGGLDFLINTIGPFEPVALPELHPAQWQQQLHSNLNITYNVSYFATAALIQSQGHIVNFSFAGADILKARPESAPYSIAKAGIVVLTKSLAAALAKHGVRVNAIAPGLIEAGEVSSAERQKLADQVPMGRPGKPLEVAQLLKWILLESPQYMSGAVIPVAGAWEYL
jgi:NAD(P)-dependent dehydrogenase (short-subunit alcohol dehydrogenase family)